MDWFWIVWLASAPISAAAVLWQASRRYSRYPTLGTVTEQMREDRWTNATLIGFMCLFGPIGAFSATVAVLIFELSRMYES